MYIYVWLCVWLANSPELRLYTGLSEPEESVGLYNVFQSRPDKDKNGSWVQVHTTELTSQVQKIKTESEAPSNVEDDSMAVCLGLDNLNITIL